MSTDVDSKKNSRRFQNHQEIKNIFQRYYSCLLLSLGLFEDTLSCTVHHECNVVDGNQFVGEITQDPGPGMITSDHGTTPLMTHIITQ